MRYEINGNSFKIDQEEDGWLTVSRLINNEYKEEIQAKTLDKALDYCNSIEVLNFPAERLC